MNLSPAAKRNLRPYGLIILAFMGIALAASVPSQGAIVARAALPSLASTFGDPAEPAADNVPPWLRYPAISPDGQTIVFTYKGDLYRVPSDGGVAVPLTIHEAHDFMPVWSHDGKWIAFASDRFGNFDIFLMPASGGEARRLTFHSASELPYAFSPDDKDIIFGAARLDTADNRLFPTGSQPELYQVPAAGGRAVQILDDAGRGRAAQPRRPVHHLPRQEGRRERVAQAPYARPSPATSGSTTSRPGRTGRSRPSPARTAPPSSPTATRTSTT